MITYEYMYTVNQKKIKFFFEYTVYITVIVYNNNCLIIYEY